MYSIFTWYLNSIKYIKIYGVFTMLNWTMFSELTYRTIYKIRVYRSYMRTKKHVAKKIEHPTRTMLNKIKTYRRRNRLRNGETFNWECEKEKNTHSHVTFVNVIVVMHKHFSYLQHKPAYESAYKNANEQISWRFFTEVSHCFL